MLKDLDVSDGVFAACRLQDDGSIMESLGGLNEANMRHFAQFAHAYRRMIGGNTDLFSLLAQMNGWTPARGWIVRGSRMTVCNVANVVAMAENCSVPLKRLVCAVEAAAHE
ncbi:MAG: DUF2173 family protein [Betaproteobacteria bacterium]|nr:DUF2173 family protein [Betaproteobacteria bacterium]